MSDDIVTTLRECAKDSRASEGDYYADQFATGAEVFDCAANEIESLRAEVARLREERLTDEERDAVAGIALVLGRLKIYPEQVGRTKQNDLDLLWRIAGEREMGE